MAFLFVASIIAGIICALAIMATIGVGLTEYIHLVPRDIGPTFFSSSRKALWVIVLASLSLICQIVSLLFLFLHLHFNIVHIVIWVISFLALAGAAVIAWLLYLSHREVRFALFLAIMASASLLLLFLYVVLAGFFVLSPPVHSHARHRDTVVHHAPTVVHEEEHHPPMVIQSRPREVVVHEEEHHPPMFLPRPREVVEHHGPFVETVVAQPPPPRPCYSLCMRRRRSPSPRC